MYVCVCGEEERGQRDFLVDKYVTLSWVHQRKM